jgi:hypothetical protein
MSKARIDPILQHRIGMDVGSKEMQVAEKSRFKNRVCDLSEASDLFLVSSSVLSD